MVGFKAESKSETLLGSMWQERRSSLAWSFIRELRPKDGVGLSMLVGHRTIQCSCVRLLQPGFDH